MRFSVGLWDALFGKKAVVEIPGPGGRTVRRRISIRWLKKMEAEGKAKNVTDSTVRVQILGTSVETPYRTEYWQIGDQLTPEQVEHFRDGATGDIFVMEYWRQGELQRTLLARSQWEQARKLVDSI